jgi:hypothetical protein
VIDDGVTDDPDDGSNYCTQSATRINCGPGSVALTVASSRESTTADPVCNVEPWYPGRLFVSGSFTYNYGTRTPERPGMRLAVDYVYQVRDAFGAWQWARQTSDEWDFRGPFNQWVVEYESTPLGTPVAVFRFRVDGNERTGTVRFDKCLTSFDRTFHNATVNPTTDYLEVTYGFQSQFPAPGPSSLFRYIDQRSLAF